MDVDNDIDSQFLQQFSSLGTTDKDVLISQFQKLLGDQLNPAGCAFFLDMNSWNLQAAICSYYDYEQPKQEKLPNMRLVRDITVGEGESVPPNTQFTKTWRLLNVGDEQWPTGVSLKFLQGETLGVSNQLMVDNIMPGDTVDVCLSMTSPVHPGIYQGQWRMSTPAGRLFGEVIWVIISVEQDGLLGVTQQLSRIGTDFITTSPHKANNPFSGVHNCSFSSSDNVSLGSPNYSIIAQQGSPLRSSPSQCLDDSTYNNSSHSPVRQVLFPQPSDIGATEATPGGDYDDDGMVS